MIDLLKEALNSPAGSFSFIFSILMLGGLIIFYVTRVLTKISVEHGHLNDRTGKTEKNIDEIRRDTANILAQNNQFVKRMDKTEAGIDQIKTDISEIKGVINIHKSDIADIKSVINLNFGTQISKKRSPEVLTEEGEKIVSDYNLDVIVHSNWDRISRAINSLGTRNPYDLQEFCFYTAYLDAENIKDAKFFSENDVDKLKIVAYKTGYPLIIITKVIMGILIRDKYFKENGIDVDVDGLE